MEKLLKFLDLDSCLTFPPPTRESNLQTCLLKKRALGPQINWKNRFQKKKKNNIYRDC